MRAFLALPLVLLLCACAPASQAQVDPAGLVPLEAEGPELRNALTLTFGGPEEARAALAWIEARGKTDMAAHVIHAMRYAAIDRPTVAATLRRLTGHEAQTWFDWNLWLQGQADLRSHASYLSLKAITFAGIDPAFTRFVRPGLRFDIKPEDILWGGVRVDGIPALDNPRLLAADAARYLNPDDEVFGVEINGDARAYPLRIMNWHEMFNDVIGGVPVSLAYCTLCGAGILFEGDHPDRARHGVTEPFTFGSSGLLYWSNKLMYDRQTDSLWNQFTGEPVVGRLAGSGITLRIRPVALTTWAKWRADHPDTRVLDIDTGFRRDYAPGAAYGAYFASQALMFPARGDARGRLAAKDQVFGMRLEGGIKAWPLRTFDGGAVINDRVGETDVVLLGDASSRTVRAYERRGLRFLGRPEAPATPAGAWTVTEDALIGPGGRRLARLPGHLAFWFAWAGYLGEESALYEPPR